MTLKSMDPRVFATWIISWCLSGIQTLIDGFTKIVAVLNIPGMEVQIVFHTYLDTVIRVLTIISLITAITYTIYNTIQVKRQLNKNNDTET